MASLKSIGMAAAGVAVGFVVGMFIYDKFVKAMANKV